MQPFVPRVIGRRPLAAVTLALLASASTTTPPALALNAPTCAQQMENLRLACRESCGKDPMRSAQCDKKCDDPDKLLAFLHECERRLHKT